MLVPSQRYARSAAANRSGSSSCPTRSRKVVFGSAFESTRPARIRSPPASATPTARPCSTTIRSTGASVRTVAPASRAASAIASVTLPIPPRTKPHWRIPPPACSAAWSWSRT